MDQIPRQAATPFALGVRLTDCQLALLRDSRRSDGHRRHRLGATIGAVILGIASNRTALRGVEALTGVLSSPVRKLIGVRRRISDTTLSEALHNANTVALHRSMVRQVLAEQRRGNLKPTADLPGSVISLDGKHQATLSHWELSEIARTQCDDDGRVFGPEDIKRLVAMARPEIQVAVQSDGSCRGLIRYHRATLTSHPSCPCVLLHAIPGDTNEVGHAPTTLRALFREYVNSSLLDIITADAGNTSAEVARVIAGGGKRYLLALKGNQPETEDEAHRLLDARPAPDAQGPLEIERGKRVRHAVYLVDARGVVPNFPTARALVRIRRTVTTPAGNAVSDESRYFVTNIALEATTPQVMMALVRGHWRCENNGHWTSDAILGEDKRRLRFGRTPQRIANIALCRMIAQNILGQLRAQSRTHDRNTQPAWSDVIFHVIRALTGAIRHRTTSEALVCP